MNGLLHRVRNRHLAFAAALAAHEQPEVAGVGARENLDIVDPLVAGTELELSPCHDRAYLRNRSSQVRLNRRSDGSTARICRSDEGSLLPFRASRGSYPSPPVGVLIEGQALVV